jgi:hypothetical protein
VPGSLLAGNLSQCGHVVTLKAMHELKQKKLKKIKYKKGIDIGNIT